MLFSPYKKHANRFSYTPRYFDPEKEAREQRRAELCGTTSEDAGREYVPGQYLRTQREARSARRANERSGGNRMRVWIMFGLALIMMLFLYRAFPTIVAAFSGKSQPASAAVEEEFDPYAPIVIVPNDHNANE
ncbi:MAG: hypothetical protein K2J51_01670 [Alistipes sp.]|nr:hypothetical protein [Alistipes sp.]MDE6778172.1 hypothetical protein [Alistipes sp.]MDE6857934.1 hypothetical protein [Alistipes sp.]